MRDDRFPVFSAGGPCEQFRHWQICPLLDVVHPAFPLPTTASATLQGALQDGSGEAVVACDMPGPCMLSFLDSCQRRFPWTHKEVDLAPHTVVGLVVQERDAKKFPHTFGFKSLDPFCQNQQAGLCFTAIGQDGGDKRLVQLELACEADGFAPPFPV